ncbi:hypothetical protein FKW77_006903 [Venturia effusa]|uniref:Uncharacterized protein n=1 Tax=Venturia effusa TaxID=50376 RepID=A0A517L3J2_9PEZI|nr:hypothetical protein FKW77_006903 [Venturia effusa]
MNRHSHQNQDPHAPINPATRTRSTAQPRPQPQHTDPPLRRPNDLTFTPTQNPFPTGPHTQTKALRLLDAQNMPTHIFFLLDRNTSPLASALLRQTVATATKRREQVGGDIYAVAKAALTSNRPALVKVMDTGWGELFVSEVGREDLAVVMFEVDPGVWRLCGVGTSFCEGRVYLLRSAPREEEGEEVKR